MKVAFSRFCDLRRVQSAWSAANDFCLGINTDDRGYSLTHARLDNESEHTDSNPYQGADYRNIRRVVRVLTPDRDDLVYDLGCGKGRVVCVFARLPVRGVVGIDLDPALCDVARINAGCLRGRRSPVEIRCEDATLADLSDGTIYFMYNPFGANTMRTVLEKIKGSLSTNPRRVRIVYYNPVFEEIFVVHEWLHRVSEFRTLTRHRVTFWSN